MRGNQFSYVVEKDDPKLPSKRKVLNYYEEEEAPVEFVSKVEEYYLHIFIKQLKQLSILFLIDFRRKKRQKDHIETLPKMAILLLKALA